MDAPFLSPTTPTPRRGFLGAAAAALAAIGLPAGARAAFASTAMPNERDALPVDEWTSAIKGTHRQFFDATSVNDGFPFAFAMTFLNTMTATYKVPDSDITAVVGLRHFSIPLVFGNDIWARYKLGEMFHIMDPATNAPAVRNPYAYTSPEHLLAPGMAFEKLQPRGVLFTCCNVALTVLSGRAATAAGLPPEKAKDEWIAGMFKGVTIVPSGVLAVNRAQKKGCTYCYAG